MLLQFPKGKPRPNGNAVVDDMQIGASKIDKTLPSRVTNVGIPNIPFPGYSPIKNLCAGSYFLDGERDSFTDEAKGFAKPIACDAAANRVELGNERMNIVADIHGIRFGPLRCNCRSGSHSQLIQSQGILGPALKSFLCLPATECRTQDHSTSLHEHERQNRIGSSDN